MKDVAFSVEDCRGLYKRALENGAKSVREPWTESDDNGTLTFACVQTVPPSLVLTFRFITTVCCSRGIENPVSVKSSSPIFDPETIYNGEMLYIMTDTT